MPPSHLLRSPAALLLPISTLCCLLAACSGDSASTATHSTPTPRAGTNGTTAGAGTQSMTPGAAAGSASTNPGQGGSNPGMGGITFTTTSAGAPAAGAAGSPPLSVAGAGGAIAGSGTTAGTGGTPGSIAGTTGKGGTPGAAGAAAGKGGAASAGAAGKTSAGAGGAGAAGKAGAGGAGAAGKAGGGGTAGAGTTPIKVWMAGDSTVMNCTGTCPCGWGSQFDPLFNPNVTVADSAVGGRSIQTWLYEAAVTSTLGTNGECTLSATTYNARWTAMLDATGGMHAGDYLFIQFGINDGDSTCPRHVGLALFQTYLGTMAQAAKARGAQPVFVTPVSAISCNSSGKAVGTRGSFVTATQTAGTTYGVPVIDLHQLSVDLYNRLGLCPNNGDYTQGAVGNFFCADHTHFEAAGATQIAALVAQALRDQGLGLASYLK